MTSSRKTPMMEDWLRIAGERGWVVLTRDDRIRYRPAEQRALIEAGTGCSA
jgi:hypothetical protein